MTANIQQSTVIRNVHSYDYSNLFPNKFNASYSSIDSLKIRLPIESVNLVNPILYEKYNIVDPYGMVIQEDVFKNKAFKDNDNGIKTSYLIQKVIVGGNKAQYEYLVILFSSKVLKTKYFEGITLNTLRNAYDYIISRNVVTFSYDTFLKGECTDIDIKVDTITEMKPVDLVNQMYSQALKKKNQREGCSVYRKTGENVGIQFALRQTTSFKRSPYLKFYEKKTELISKSTTFMQNYVDIDRIPDNLLRTETTIKNKKHLKALGFKDNGLRYICSKVEDIGLLSFKYAFKAHLKQFKYKEVIEPKDSKLLMSERYLLLSINLLQSGNELTQEEITHHILEKVCFDKDERRRAKKAILRLFSSCQNGNNSNEFTLNF